MKILVLIYIGIVMLMLSGYSQKIYEKPKIDTSVYGKWPEVDELKISSNGRYVSYIIKNQPVGRETGIFQSSDSKWKYEILDPNIWTISMTGNSRYGILKERNDTLVIVEMGTKNIQQIPNVSEYSIIENRKNTVLAYRLTTDVKTLYFKDLLTKKVTSISEVNGYKFSSNSRVMVFYRDSIINGKTCQSLNWSSLVDGKVRSFWVGASVDDVKFDNSCSQIIFSSNNDPNTMSDKTFWYYKEGQDSARKLSGEIGKSEPAFGAIMGFSKDGERVFFSYKSGKAKRSVIDGVRLKIWSYADPKLRSTQADEIEEKSYLYVWNIKNDTKIRLQFENEQLLNCNPSDSNVGEYILILKRLGSASEAKWNLLSRSTIFLVSTMTGERRVVKDGLRDASWLSYVLSPNEKFVIYKDSTTLDFFSLNIQTKEVCNITQNLPILLEKEVQDERFGSECKSLILSKWSFDDKDVFISDSYDMWKVDPNGKNVPVSVTREYGKRNNIVFRFCSSDEDIIVKNEKVHLIAFNKNNKENGFYVASLDGRADPEVLSMGAYTYFIPTAQWDVSQGSLPVKANGAKMYALKRGNSKESYNYFTTNDFKHFVRLSNLQPEKRYNWMTTELHSWRTLDSTICQGVLYKPEDFDSTKKYPLIFYIYQRLSEGLNSYIKPAPSDGKLNIAWYVSNGYLVFTPDIHYKIGEPGKSALSSVITAVHYLSKFSFVDSTRFGIQGVSHGGFETNYIISNTNIFSAACSASAASDLISKYGSLSGDGEEGQSYYEQGQGRIGATIWEDPQKYIENSPIFRADRIYTPLLIFHTTNDGAVPFTQAVELFTALRRLQKRAWMLEYGDGNHGVSGKAALDFSIKMSQFFDHFLKNKPAPIWMTTSVSR